MDVYAKLDEITTMIEGARAMPMSASCLVHRADLLALLDDLRELLPVELTRAAALLRERDEVVEQGRAEAARLLEEAARERSRMVSESDVAAAAALEAQRLVTQAREDAERTRAEVDDYVDAKLANFEVVLQKTLKAVERGRAKLVGHEDLVAAGLGEPGVAAAVLDEVDVTDTADGAPLSG